MDDTETLTEQEREEMCEGCVPCRAMCEGCPNDGLCAYTSCTEHVDRTAEARAAPCRADRTR